MSGDSLIIEKTAAYIKLLQNPYASLSIYEQAEDVEQVATTSQKHNYVKALQNPYAHIAVFGETETPPPVIRSQTLPFLPTLLTPGRCSKKAFEDGCRRACGMY